MHQRFGSLIGLASLLAGCPSLRPHACLESHDCDLREGGACIDGFCAYPDPACTSGFRWSKNAPEGGRCVPEGANGDEADGTTTESGADTPPPEGCGVRLPIRIDGEALAGSSSLESYPLLVDIEHEALVEAVSPFFTDPDGQPLAFELEMFDPDLGRLRAWVRLPLVGGGPLDIELRFGAPAAVPPNDPVDVWASWYLGVWHLDDALTEGEDVVRDSTANGEHGLTRGLMTADRVVPAVVGSGFAFAGGEDAVEFEAAFAGTLESFTISLWARVDGDGTVEGPFFERVNGDNLYPRCRKRFDEDGAIQCQIRDEEGIVHVLRGDADAMPRGEFRHLALVLDAEAGLFELYIDGVRDKFQRVPPGPSQSGSHLPQIGRIQEFNSLTGLLDEFRVADRALSAAWIAADVVSQRDPSSVLAEVGAAEPLGCP